MGSLAPPPVRIVPWQPIRPAVPRRVATVRYEPFVSGDLFPWKLRVRVLDGPEMLVSSHSTEETAQRNAKEIANEF